MYTVYQETQDFLCLISKMLIQGFKIYFKKGF
jgi:hypothetical protein